ncbi:MAG: pilus assembly protein PilM [Lachnospiraceae bacterium]|nr:pilus assembly protein PilM [Lachnospiraceae bacterium]
MARKVLTISLGSEIVKVCEVALAGKKKVQVYNAIDLIIPEGLCDDGVILDAQALASAIKQGLAGEGFSSKKVIFTITSKRIANKEAVIPFCKENRIKDIIQINAAEYFPITNLENYTFNHSIMEVVQNEGIKNYRLSVTATPNELIEQYYELAKAMGMGVETIDFSGNSILQLLKLQTAGEGIDAVLQVGGENTVVNIMNGSTMIMQRSIPYGRLAIADAVKNARGISDDEADMMLIEENLGVLVGTYPDVADTVRAMLSSIGRILEFYRARNTEHPIERIYMIGDVMSVNGLAELVDDEFEQEVQVVEQLRGVEVKNHHVLSDEIVANYLANIGAVIAPMGLTLAPTSKRSEKAGGEKLPWWILIFAGVVAIGMCGGILFVYYNENKEADNLRAQIAAIEDVSSLKERYEQSQADVGIMESWFDTTKGANESLAKFVDDLEEKMPKGIAITRLSSNEGEMTIEGKSFGKPSIAEFVKKLKELPYVSNVKMDIITETIEDSSAEDTFTLTLSLKYDDPKKDSGEDEEESVEDSAQEEEEEASAENVSDEASSEETQSGDTENELQEETSDEELQDIETENDSESGETLEEVPGEDTDAGDEEVRPEDTTEEVQERVEGGDE